ncbi:MAG: hypothetical protein ACPHP0_03710 [Flavobacteriaceae bacterium]|jgi:hypothetical protein
MFESQSNTVSLLQESVPHVPLFLHPFGWPFLLVAQLAHPILLYIMTVCVKSTNNYLLIQSIGKYKLI